MKAVFDWDGVFNNITEHMAKYLGMPCPNKWHAEEATNISLFQARAIQSSYYNMKQYKKMLLADEMSELLHKNPTPYIYSANMCKEMEEYKRETVYRLAPHFPEDHLILMPDESKPVLKWADVMVEDGPHYLAQYPAKILRILIDHPYNRDCDIACIRVPDLKKAIKTIQQHFPVWR